MTPAASQRRAEAARRREYDRWLSRPSPSSLAIRWAMGSLGAFFVNSPLFRLPENLHLKPDQRLLDIGCGRGSVQRVLHSRVHFREPPVGIDFSAVALAMAREDEQGIEYPSEFARASAVSLPFRDGVFDVITSGYVLKHLSDEALHLLFDEVWRVLAPGGLAVLWEFAPTRNTLLNRWNRHWLGRGVSDIRLRSTRTLRGFATQAGFPFVRSAQLRPFLLPPIPRASILIGRPPEGWAPKIDGAAPSVPR